MEKSDLDRFTAFSIQLYEQFELIKTNIYSSSVEHDEGEIGILLGEMENLLDELSGHARYLNDMDSVANIRKTLQITA